MEKKKEQQPEEITQQQNHKEESQVAEDKVLSDLGIEEETEFNQEEEPTDDFLNDLRTSKSRRG